MPGTYCITEPVVTLRAALGAGTVTPQPSYDAPRVDVDQPVVSDAGWVVTVIADGVPVRQRANPTAPEVAPPLRTGDSFIAPMILYGTDGKPWWLSDRKGRVPFAGTTCVALESVF